MCRSSADKKYEVNVAPDSTVAELKAILAEKSSIPVERQRVIFSGRILKDPETLSSYKIAEGNTIHLIRGAPPKDSSSSSTSQPAPTVPANIATGVAPGNPLADLTGARYAGYASLPSASMFGPDGGMSATTNPDDLLNMLNSPGFREQMDTVLSNPAVVDMMINSNPQLRSMGPQIRNMMQSPMFRNMMSNPEAMRQIMSMQNAMGGGPGSQTSSFPAPGGATGATTEDSTVATAGTDATNSNGFPNLFASGLGGAGGAGGAAGAANPFSALLDPSLLGGAGGAGGAGAAGMNPDFLASLLGGGAAAAPQQPADTRPPEERYEAQLRQLNELGFFDFDRNVRALRRSGGNVQGAIEALLDGQV